MEYKYTLQEARSRADELMRRGNHCGPTVLQVMWETTGFGSEDLLWASMAFNGGIAGHRDATCGALSGAIVYLGLINRLPEVNLPEFEAPKKNIRQIASSLASQFKQQYGALPCEKIVGVDLSDRSAADAYAASGKWITHCSGIVQFVISRLYDL